MTNTTKTKSIGWLILARATNANGDHVTPFYGSTCACISHARSYKSALKDIADCSSDKRKHILITDACLDGHKTANGLARYARRNGDFYTVGLSNKDGTMVLNPSLFDAILDSSDLRVVRNHLISNVSGFWPTRSIDNCGPYD